jgi:hypothetical protein
MDITISKDFRERQNNRCETPEDKSLLEEIEKFFMDVKKGKHQEPFRINNVDYWVVRQNPPNTDVLCFCNEEQKDIWKNDYLFYARPYAKPICDFALINPLRNKLSRKNKSLELCLWFIHSKEGSKNDVEEWVERRKQILQEMREIV